MRANSSHGRVSNFINNIYFSSSACLRPIRLDNSVPLCLVPDPWLHSSWAASVIIPATCPQTGNTPNILSSCPGCLLSPCPTSLYSWSFLDKQLTYLTWCVCLFIIFYKNIYVMTIRVADPCHYIWLQIRLFTIKLHEWIQISNCFKKLKLSKQIEL